MKYSIFLQFSLSISYWLHKVIIDYLDFLVQAIVISTNRTLKPIVRGTRMMISMIGHIHPRDWNQNPAGIPIRYPDIKPTAAPAIFIASPNSDIFAVMIRLMLIPANIENRKGIRRKLCHVGLWPVCLRERTLENNISINPHALKTPTISQTRFSWLMNPMTMKPIAMLVRIVYSNGMLLICGAFWHVCDVIFWKSSGRNTDTWKEKEKILISGFSVSIEDLIREPGSGGFQSVYGQMCSWWTYSYLCNNDKLLVKTL